MKTESNIKPSVRLEIEAFPKREGAACTVILYDNIEGPLSARRPQKENQHRNTTDMIALKSKPDTEKIWQRV